MKLLRHGPAGAEKPALVAKDGSIRDLSGVIADFNGEALSDAGLARLAAIDPMTLPEVSVERIGACLPRPGKFICVGLNYADHAKETGKAPPEEPILFMKATSAVVGPNDDVEIPRGSKKADWEVELGVVIGTRAKYVSEADALNHVAGYCVVNDVSERAFQSERGGQWTKGKSHRPLACHTRRGGRPSKPRAVAGCRWRTPADRQHENDDLQRRPPRQLYQPIHDAGARRRDRHRHAAGCGHGYQAGTCLPEAWPSHDARDRRSG